MAISASTVRRLLMESAGYCANPECQRLLYTEFDDGNVGTIAELAHVVAESRQGPRGGEPLDEAERDAYENLVLLCPSCHALIDKHPDEYPVERLHAWKRDHLSTVRQLMSPVFSSRAELRERLRPLMSANRAVHRDLGPESEPPGRLEPDAVKLWRGQVLTVILPNNQRIYAMLQRNDVLLTDDERRIVGDFLVHIEAFEYNQLSGDKNAAAPVFPDEMNGILGGM